MDLAYNTAPVGNTERHANVIAGWQLAQNSPHTLTAYTRDLLRYCTWLDLLSLNLLTVRRVHVDGYRHTLTGAPSTVARTLAALSSFYQYALSEDLADRNPVLAVTRPTVDVDHSSTQGMNRDQAKALLKVARAHGPRSDALVNLLMFTGVRISEALGASTADYGHDAGHRTLTIRRKGGKQAKVAVPAPAVVALNHYLGTTGADLVLVQGMSRPLFTPGTGRAWNRTEAFRTMQRLARRAVSKYAKRLRRIQLDAKHERQRRVLSIRQELEAELSDHEPGVDAESLGGLVESLVPTGPSSTSHVQLGLPRSAPVQPIQVNQQFFGHVEGIVAQNINGNVTQGSQPEELLKLIQLHGGGRADDLLVAVRELADVSAPKSTRLGAK